MALPNHPYPEHESNSAIAQREQSAISHWPIYFFASTVNHPPTDGCSGESTPKHSPVKRTELFSIHAARLIASPLPTACDRLNQRREGGSITLDSPLGWSGRNFSNGLSIFSGALA